MKVHELAAILEHVPGDLDVLIFMDRGGRADITDVCRRTSTDPRGPHVMLASWRAPWGEPELPAGDFRLSGPFRRRAELARRLDPDVPPETAA